MDKLNQIHFLQAQKLYNLYSTSKSNKDLRECLYKVFGDEFENESNPRNIINQLLINYYPNEAVIKACFINSILFKSKNHTSIFELNVGSSRVDLCKINGESIAYEIKTDLDNIKRLEKQLNDYITVFEKVFIICSKSKYTEVLNEIIPECGIYIYNKTKRGRYSFKKIKEAIKSDKIIPEKQLDILTKQDLSHYFNIDKELSRDDMYSHILKKYNSKQINDIFKKCIRHKYYNEWCFLMNNRQQIQYIDYQWFFKNRISPDIIYK